MKLFRKFPKRQGGISKTILFLKFNPSSVSVLLSQRVLRSNWEGMGRRNGVRFLALDLDFLWTSLLFESAAVWVRFIPKIPRPWLTRVLEDGRVDRTGGRSGDPGVDEIRVLEKGVPGSGAETLLLV